MSADLYQEIILEEYRHPHNYGSFEHADLEWKEQNSSCGDEVTVYLKLNPDMKKIVKMEWLGAGCAISTASVSLLSVHVRGMEVGKVLKMTKFDLEKLLGIEEIAYGREKCLTLGLEAVQKSLKEKKTQ